MSLSTVITVQNLSKKFSKDIKWGMLHSLKDLISDIFPFRKPKDQLRSGEFWALKDVSLEIRKGQCVALLGKNGSGKTTLLRVLSGIFYPDQGKVITRGRVGALIALGSSFHPNMTGRENIFLNGALLGLTEGEIKARFPNIVSFSEIAEFIDAPVSTYSSGMSARLGFSIAAFCDAEILLVDEVLAVGDLAFALKCYKKMAEFRSNGGTTVLVTHNNQIVRNICDYAYWFDKGTIVAQGPAQEIADKYEFATTESEIASTIGNILHNDSLAKIKKIELLDGSESKVEFKTGDSFVIRIHFEVSRLVEKPLFGVSIENMESHSVICNFSSLDGKVFPAFVANGAVDFRIEKLMLRRGRYLCTVSFCEGDPSNSLSWFDRTISFTVSGGSASQGMYDPIPTWTLISNPHQ